MSDKTAPPGQTRKRGRWAPVLVAVLVLAVPGIAGLIYWGSRNPAPEGNPFPVPPLSESPYLHTRAGVGYVGTKACIGCHHDQYESYLRTQHAHSLAEVDLDAQPPDGTYFHQASGRAYQVFRKDGKLWHRESLRLEGGGELLLSEYPMRYAFGSGTHTRSYVVEDDGFLIESPVTWYRSRDRWDMSPGYDQPYHYGFERVASFRCFLCHAGQVEHATETSNRVKLHELAIGCERCHGPGELHVKKRRAEEKFVGEDLTILRPDRLSRELNESICAQCHLGEAAGVDVRGHGIADFRPGLPLTDFHIDYKFKTPQETMAVVGHFSQMRQSLCYQRSGELTCTTCHRLHHKPAEARKVDYYRARCLSCHDTPDKGCGLPREARLGQNAEDSCIACHMPTSRTDLPHIAFTHHRIAIHDPAAEDKAPTRDEPGTLVPVHDDSHLPEVDRERNLGLAYRKLAGDSLHRKYSKTYRRRARKLLEEVRDRGLRDPEVDAALAILLGRQDPERSKALAEEALRGEAITPEARRDALMVLRTIYFDRSVPPDVSLPDFFVVPPGDFDASFVARTEECLRQLVRIRRDMEDWMLLGVCRHAAGDDPGALEAVRQATRIAPSNPVIQQILALLYERAGLPGKAAEQRRKATQLARRASP